MPRPDEMALARLAARQEGVLGCEQLRLAGGLSNRSIAKRAERGRLHRLHRGVFALGHDNLQGHAWLRAALLAVGCDAAISHRSAGGLLSIRVCRRSVVEVTIPTRNGRARREGLQIHRSPFGPGDVIEIDGIRVTDPSRTLLDLAAVLGDAALARAIDRADELGLLDLERLRELADRSRGRRGVARLRRVMRAYEPRRGVLRSGAERRLELGLRRRGLPEGLANYGLAVGGTFMEVDRCWPELRLVLEVDGPSHARTASREADALRAQQLAAAGWSLIRVTETQLELELAGVMDRVTAAIRRRSAAL